MTIRRQYQLPNCSLILDGLSIDPTPGNENVMSLLVNAECRISGLERSLNGGYNFFAALVRAVSQYGQEVLSGFAHPQVIEGEPLLVHINPGDGPYHHLVVQPEVADLGSNGDGRAIDIKLSAVQLFDLTEAVDQFFADSQTLPELEPALSPLPRRFVRTEEPFSQQAMPVVLGIGGLVAATMALSLLPLPEIREPALEDRAERAGEVNTVDNTAASPPTGEEDPPAAEEASSIAQETDTESEASAESETEEADELSEPDSDLAVASSDLSEDQRDRQDDNASDLSERDGPEEADSLDAVSRERDRVADRRETDRAGLEDRLEDSLEDSLDLEDKPSFATFDSFTDDEARNRNLAASGNFDFSDAPPDDGLGLAYVENLNSQLKRSLVESRSQPRVGKAAAAYRVRFNEDGNVMGYQPIDEVAAEAIDETSLPNLVESAPEEIPAVDYRVVFTERGVIEVSPWWGWNYYR